MSEQLDFPFEIDHAALRAFLARWEALEAEQARLRDEMRLCKAAYQDQLPMRPVLTAMKVWRARRTLEAHPKEPLSLAHQGVLEGMIAEHLAALDAEQSEIPDMWETGEERPHA